MIPRITKAGHWHQAKLRGERLPEHELPPACDFCGNDCSPDDFSPVASAFICTDCVEAALAARNLEQVP